MTLPFALGNGDALALAAGELTGIAMAAASQAKALEHRVGAFVRGIAPEADATGGNHEVAALRAVLEQRIVPGRHAHHAGTVEGADLQVTSMRTSDLSVQPGMALGRPDGATLDAFDALRAGRSIRLGTADLSVLAAGASFAKFPYLCRA
jgi:hypothetical protein